MANKSLHADRDILQSTTDAKEARLEEKIDELEKENAELHEWASTVESKNAKLLERSSTSRASRFSPVLSE